MEVIGRQLRAARQAWREAHHRHLEVGFEGFPSRQRVEEVVNGLCAALFPRRLGEATGETDEDAYVEATLGRALDLLHEQVKLELRYWSAEAAQPFDDEDAANILRHFAAGLPEIRSLIDSDVEAAFLGDPAARSVDEILICYPGALAVIHHRLAHRLHGLGAPLIARIISEIANTRTGIDIHPGATIGPNFFIDHGTGVVIGETAIIGARVRLYQAVTLGARKLPGNGLSMRERFARHPIIEDDVVIYAGATILGRVTIGRGSVIGGNVWLVEDVPAESFVTQGEVRLRVTSASGLPEER
ncbi:serine O-acetyltransferase EpsC [Sphingomonas sp. ID0503]|uniref:serine O-acetyltransferase EpsC n=1 Tax=Sphingomonas sp. ID0503 TaxID=3399691 RepID=UPI003AFAE0D2